MRKESVMKKVDLREHFFKQKILVNMGEEPTPHIAELSFALASKFGIKIVSGMENASFEMVSLCESIIGTRVPPAFYRGFPQSVLKLVRTDDQLLLLDQLLHYAVTYGMGITSAQGRSMFEDAVERTALSEERELKEFSVITKDEAQKMIAEAVDGYLKSTRPLNKEQQELVCAYVGEYEINVEACACKQTAFALLRALPERSFAHLITLSDIIALVEEIVDEDEAGKSIRELHLKNSHKRLVSRLLDEKLALGADYTECLEKRESWKGLLHHIHYKPKNDHARAFVEEIRYGKKRSAYSDFEGAISSGDIARAVDILREKKGSGALLRQLNYILSRCKDEEQVKYVLDNMRTNNPIILIQLLLKYSSFDGESARTFKFIKHKRLVSHKETGEECLSRKSQIPAVIQAQLISILWENLRQIYKKKQIGRVFIEQGMEKMALPLQESATQDGYGVMTRGSRLAIPEGKKVRAFTYWERVDDIDLSVMGFTYDNSKEAVEFSWRTMNRDSKQSEAICYSGDQTSGYEGGSEYFDINIDEFRKMYPEIRYVVLTNNMYSDLTFDKCVCRAGYMIRDNEDSGEIFEPKTVESSYTINAPTAYAYLFAIDLKEREIVWLNTAFDSDSHISAQSAIRVDEYLNITRVINVKDLFSMLATEIVADPSEADVIVGLNSYELKEGQRYISPVNTSAILPLVNNKQ